MSNYISILGLILVTAGTILSLWSVLGTKTKDVQTAAWYDHQQENFKKDKTKVVIGTALIFLGTLFQIAGVLI